MLILIPLLLLPAQAGDYLGAIQIGATQLRVALHVTRDDASGEWKGAIDSLDQGARGLPVKLSIEHPSIRFGSGFGMTYEGAFNDARTEIRGFATQGGQKMALDFKKVDQIGQARRPQTPIRPFPYAEEEVSVQSGKLKLGGTLTLPQGAGPFNAVIFLTGSGAQDRDETLFEHKPFLVIADHLTRNGFATLRLDDRGVGKSAGVLAQSTLEDLAGDGAAALEYLKRRKEIKRIGFLGHSEGGVTGPLAALRAAGEAAFVILLAGTGVPGDELLYEQGQAALKASGADARTMAFQANFHKVMLPLVKAEKDNAALQPRILEAWRKMKAADPLAEAADKQVAPQLQMFLLPAMQSFIRHDPRPALAELTCPVLALNGTLDTQVLAGQNLPAIAQALARGKHPDYTIASMRHLNHLFQTAKSGALAEYGQIEETIAPQALDLITGWLKSKTN